MNVLVPIKRLPPPGENVRLPAPVIGPEMVFLVMAATVRAWPFRSTGPESVLVPVLVLFANVWSAVRVRGRAISGGVMVIGPGRHLLNEPANWPGKLD